MSRRGICTFSCALHWKAVGDRQPGTRFADSPGFYEYARTLGAEGVQVSLGGTEPSLAKAIRSLVEASGGYYEGDLRLPGPGADLAAFETQVRLARDAGASVARAVLMGGRRYEVFRTLKEFQEFRAAGEQTLGRVEPILRRHRLKLAIENHKDLTSVEQLEVLRKIGSEWIGSLVDTGNSIALLEDPYAVVENLAPLALSVHLKDMAVQPHDDGFLLSEVPMGTGFLDLPRIIATLHKANPGIVFNLEMATRDPLKIPCLTEGYWATFPDRGARELAAAMALVKRNPPRQPPPSITGRTPAEQLALEETNNRVSLAWMKDHITA